MLLEDDTDVAYDTLVLATGARHAYFGHDEWEPFAPGLKTLEDATTLRRRILVAFERAERERDPARRAAWMTFVIVGGVPGGCPQSPRGCAGSMSASGQTAGQWRSGTPLAAIGPTSPPSASRCSRSVVVVSSSTSPRGQRLDVASTG